MDLSQRASADKPASAPLAEPITVAKWWKNRRRNESMHVTLSEYEGRAIVSVRVYSTGTDGIDRPSPKGISMAVDKLPILAQALVKAEAKARELGLIGAPTAEKRARA